MYKKISVGLVVLLITSLFLVACQDAPVHTAHTEADCTATEVLCVGLVTSLAGVNDQSFNQMAWEGILNAQAEKVADRVQYIETIDAKDYDTNIATFTDAGFDIIVTVGDLYSRVTTSAAKSYPNNFFIGVDQDQTDILPNLAGLVFHADQAGFQAGALAALLTRTNTVVAVLGPNTVPTVVALKEGYEAGAKSVKPNINIIATYYPGNSDGSTTDPRWSASTALQAIQNGADVVFDAGGMTGNGALIEAASHPGLFCIGNDSDLWETIPGARACLVTSAMKLVNQGVFDMIKLAREGAFPSGNYFGDSGLASYHDFDTLIPQAIKDEMDRIKADLLSGSISSGTQSP